MRPVGCMRFSYGIGYNISGQNAAYACKYGGDCAIVYLSRLWQFWEKPMVGFNQQCFSFLLRLRKANAVLILPERGLFLIWDFFSI